MSAADVGAAQSHEFESVRRGICPDCGFGLPAHQRSAGTVECTNCGALWSIEHKPAPPH